MTVSRTVLRQRLEHALGVEAQRLASLRQATAEGRRGARHEVDGVNLLGMLLQGLDEDEIPVVPEDEVGYGSLVAVRDLDSGEKATYRIMSGAALDLSAGHISLDSALGSALEGGSVGSEVEAHTPGGRRRLRIEALRTLHSLLDETREVPEARAPRGAPGRAGLEEASL